ncbi:YhcN/YlaJ family sporulation lipoprotein [Caldibacillus lycopersici]|uniref:YhcN/YlaJ family sporulation lipoprotein n=1 Tax=Perspicuibacillus lycopersici TaxID=1325689 RepID=A0AAE3IQB0_9BACI|nr:YhcN/YlaJ family sporulation lipoprotein [Perspicuibacillus lycopersici]MCU9612421.1 YhcN/YlaJ family sporulation lipoprotein [Perspicuibacillus lycopersici]
MKEKKYQGIQKAFVCFLFLLVLSACQAQNDTSETRTALLKTTNPSAVTTENKAEEEQLVAKIKQKVLSMKEIYDVAVIKGEKEILVAYKVRHLQRFHMKKIEKNLQEKLEKAYPDENFSVSSDYKIFLEAVRLQEKSEHGKVTRDEMEEQLGKIFKLSKEKT